VSAHAGALEAVDRILNRGGDPEDVLRAVLRVLHERLFAWVGLAVREDGQLGLAHEAGERPAAPPLTAHIAWQGRRVGELQALPREAADRDADEALLDRVALLISAQLRPR
jgi:hypothetical protein